MQLSPLRTKNLTRRDRDLAPIEAAFPNLTGIDRTYYEEKALAPPERQNFFWGSARRVRIPNRPESILKMPRKAWGIEKRALNDLFS